MTVRKIIIRFCKNIESFAMKSINVQGVFLFCAGWIFVLCRVEFSKIGKHDVTFIREMRVSKEGAHDPEELSKYGFECQAKVESESRGSHLNPNPGTNKNQNLTNFPLHISKISFKFKI